MRLNNYVLSKRLGCICPTAWVDELGWHPKIQVACSVHGFPALKPKPKIVITIEVF